MAELALIKSGHDDIVFGSTISKMLWKIHEEAMDQDADASALARAMRCCDFFML
jgi:hypothetical protein